MDILQVDELVILQCSATELVIYCRLAGIVVTISWPIHNIVKIKASGLRAWLLARRLECFCGFTSHRTELKPCQFVVSKVTSDVFGFCHYAQARCPFKINFTEVHDTCLLTSEYPNLPTLVPGEAPDMDILLVAFTLHGYPHQDLAPHFEGYAGEHNSGYPAGTHLLTRRPSNAHVSRHRRQSSPYRRYQRQIPASNARYVEINNLPPHRLVQTAPACNANVNAEASPSLIPMDSASRRLGIQTEGKEGNILQKLIVGQGISEGLIEKCSMCRRLFTASALKGHIQKCLGIIDLS
ncbi:hypothetical protein DFH07DRAFT_954380 [Mycena maculata]|uniref:Uncharacterized protein n=1 Tax=Mycena maculata TaxID=230809 RepID=A0AAD7JPP7_9AGAR|nr:hypothetical protein DFH07DRAFT_954380 [Mycena maculata]